MNVSHQDYIAYCNGSLSKERMLAIQLFLKENPIEKRALDGALEYSKSGDFDLLVNKINTRIDQSKQTETTVQNTIETNSPRVGRIISLSVAAAAIGLIIFFLFPSNSNNQYAFEQNFDKYPDVLTNVLRGKTIDVPHESIRKGMAAYNNDEFKKAISHLEGISEDLDEYETVRFYTAISHLANKDPEKSIKIFSELNHSDVFLYADGVQWYTALAYLEMDQKEKANTLLKKIAESDHYKNMQAKKILMK